MTQAAAGNPHPPSVPNQSFGYNANFMMANSGLTSPMQPYYFPFIVTQGSELQGYFDWRPKDINEAIVAAHSTDGGQSWQFQQMALVLTQALPVNQQSSNPDASLADDGFGHPTVIQIGNTPFLYTLDRSADAVDRLGLVVTQLSPTPDMPLNGALPNKPLVFDFTDESKVIRTVGLLNPDGILAVVPNSFPVTVLYIQKIGNGDDTGSTRLPGGQQCRTQPYTPPGDPSPNPANHDIVHVRIATTSDGIVFQDQGIVFGLNDPTATSYAGTRYIAPGGTMLYLGGGRFGLFFSGGNCMDADSDAFHYIGYAESTDPSLQGWTVINDINNPIASTQPQTVPVNGIPTTIPAAMPVVGPTLDWFAARAYSPSVLQVDNDTYLLTFSGYHVYSPKDDFLDYRTIVFVKLKATRIAPVPVATATPLL